MYKLLADVAVAVAFESRIYHRVKALFPLANLLLSSASSTLLSYLRESLQSLLSEVLFTCFSVLQLLSSQQR